MVRAWPAAGVAAVLRKRDPFAADLIRISGSSQAAEGRSFFRGKPFPNLLRNLSNRTQAKRKNCNSGGMR
jgi:hypothetical protein